jgi:hypothetical protein
MRADRLQNWLPPGTNIALSVWHVAVNEEATGRGARRIGCHRKEKAARAKIGRWEWPGLSGRFRCGQPLRAVREYPYTKTH